MSLSTGDKVYIDCIGKWRGSEGTVIGRKDNGAYIVAFDESSPEPGRCEAFAEEHLIPSMKNLREDKVSEIKDSGKRTKVIQEFIQEFIMEVPLSHIVSMVLQDNVLRITCRTVEKE